MQKKLHCSVELENLRTAVKTLESSFEFSILKKPLKTHNVRFIVVGTRILPMFPLQTSWTFEVAKLITIVDRMMWAMASRTQFQFAVGDIINSNMGRRSLHHIHFLAFTGFVADQLNVVVGSV